eukprot:10674139-Heterocapsa_arctica.AAC.1
MAAHEGERGQYDHVEGLESKLMAEDIRNINRHKLSESEGAWITNMNDKILGELTAWTRMREITA